MQNLVDHNGRTIWFSGPPGPMKPTNSKSRGKRTSKNETKLSEEDHDYSPKKAKKSENECVIRTGLCENFWRHVHIFLLGTEN